MKNKMESADKDGKKKEPKRKDIKDQAMGYLEYRSHTAAEVRKHLKEKGYAQEQIEECMAFLLECHFVDDEVYCLHYIEYAMEKGRGPLRIRQELLQKGISGVQIDLGLEDLLDSRTQQKMAWKQAQKSLGILGTDRLDVGQSNAESGDMADDDGEGNDEGYSEKELAKVGRKLAALGYPTSVIYSVIGQFKRRRTD